MDPFLPEFLKFSAVFVGGSLIVFLFSLMRCAAMRSDMEERLERMRTAARTNSKRR